MRYCVKMELKIVKEIKEREKTKNSVESSGSSEKESLRFEPGGN